MRYAHVNVWRLNDEGAAWSDDTARAVGARLVDLAAQVDRLRAAGVRFRNDGGLQILLEDPSGNPIELFQPRHP